MMKRVAAILCTVLTISLGKPIFADDAAKAPTVVVGRTTAGVVGVLVDVTDALVANDPKTTPDATLKHLELVTLDALDENADRLPKNAKRAHVSVIYQKTGAVSPMYKTATFTGVERLLSLNLGVSAKDRAAARAALVAAKPPAGLVTVTGQLPRPQP